MLVITRREGEGFMIGDGIEVTIERITRDQVKVGIIAPIDIRIDRTEVYSEKKHQEIDRTN